LVSIIYIPFKTIHPSIHLCPSRFHLIHSSNLYPSLGELARLFIHVLAMTTTHIINVGRPTLARFAKDELVTGMIAQFTRVRNQGIGFGFAEDGERVAAASAVAMRVLGGGVFGGAEPDRGAEEGFDAGGVDGDDCDELVC
jgi:hypothetical protein